MALDLEKTTESWRTVSVASGGRETDGGLLKPRHTVAMALSASIGTGLWIASARSLHYGGPVGLIIGFAVVGLGVYLVCNDACELIQDQPHKHGMFGYARAWLGDAAAFAMVCNYGLAWFFVYPAELVAASALLSSIPNAQHVPRAAWIVILIVLTVGSPLLPPKWYGEMEFLFSIIKICALVLAAVFIAVCDAGGIAAYTPDQHIVWSADRLFGIGGRGPLLAIVAAGFALGGTELFTLACNQSRDPRRTARNNIRAIACRVIFCYLLTVACFATVVSSDLASLAGPTSPVLEAIRLSGLPALHTTVVILLVIALISAADTAIYLFGRTLVISAEMGFVPETIRRMLLAQEPLLAGGTPEYSAAGWPIAVVMGVGGCIAFSTLSHGGSRAFGVLIDVVAMGNYVNWLAMLATHVQFLRSQRGAPLWKWLADVYVGLLVVLVFAAQIVLGIDPLAKGTSPGVALVANFALPVAAVAIFGGRWWMRRSYPCACTSAI
ncbi:hypothetical protein PYCC9005_005220 [Savitreella phatthalungensis]